MNRDDIKARLKQYGNSLLNNTIGKAYQPRESHSQHTLRGSATPVSHILGNLYKGIEKNTRDRTKVVDKSRYNYQKNVTRGEEVHKFFSERNKVAQVGGSLSGTMQGVNGGMVTPTYEGREALIKKNQLRTQQLRDNRLSNIEKVYGRTSTGQTNRQEYNKRTYERRVEARRTLKQPYLRHKAHMDKQSTPVQKRFRGPVPYNPGPIRPKTKVPNNRTTSARERWKTAVDDARLSKGSRYTNAADRFNYKDVEQRRYDNPKTAQGKLLRNAQTIQEEYQDKTQIRGKSAREASAVEAKISKFSPAEPYSLKGNYNTSGKIAGSNKFSPMKPLSELDELWNGVKKKAIDFVSSKLDSKADIHTAVWNDMDPEVKGVRGFAGASSAIDGISNLSEKELKHYRQAVINEASKSVRYKGDNVDPFHSSPENTRVQNLRKAQEAIKIRTGGDVDGYYEKQQQKITQQRSEFYNKYQSARTQSTIGDLDTGHLDTDEWKAFNARSEKLKHQQNITNRIMSEGNPYIFQHGKKFRPTEGTSGYGLGFKDYMKASRSELAGRGLGFAVGLGSGEALLNTFGIMTAKQKAVVKANGQRGLFAKMMTPGMQAVAGTYMSLGFTVASGGDASDFIANQLSVASGLQGWRVGSSVGGLFGKARLTQSGATTGTSVLNGIKSGVSSGITRGGLGVVGGLTGFAVGMAAVQSAAWAISDLTSNQSSIRKVAKDFSRRTTYVDTGYTRQSLTSKQMALNKLARSGLNDRAMLLGNEARVMKGIM